MKVALVFFEHKPDYQTYIDKLIYDLSQNSDLQVVKCFLKIGHKRIDNISYYSPGERERWIYKKFWQIISKKYKGLNYFEIWCLRNQIDVIHVMHSFLFKYFFGLLKMDRSIRPKIVITLRGGDTYIKPWQNKEYRDFYREYGNIVDRFICQSNDHQAYLNRWCIAGCNSSVITVSHGYAKEAPEKTYDSNKPLRIVSIFRVSWEKNILGNLLTIKDLVKREVPIFYGIYGGGNYEGQIPFLIDKLNLTEVVEYYGFTPSNELDKLLGSYDVYLQLSISEASGTSVLEAQAKGLPVVVSDSGGLPEMVIAGKTGFVVPFQDYPSASSKIQLLKSDSKLYRKFSSNASQFVNEQYSLEVEVSKTLDLYIELVNK